MNNRINIRQAVKTLLSGATSAGTNVFTNRSDKLWSTELPSILISTGSEEALPETQRAQRYVRTVDLLVTVKCVSVTGDEIDALAGQIEDLIIANPNLGAAAVSSTTLLKTETTLEGENETDKAEAVLTFQCKYIA